MVIPYFLKGEEIVKGGNFMQMLNSTNNLKVAKYFNLSEFACPCCNLVMLHPKLLAKLVELRNAGQIGRVKEYCRKTGLY